MQDVMVVGEPTLMGGEFGDEDERLITRLENQQFEPSLCHGDEGLHDGPSSQQQQQQQFQSNNSPSMAHNSSPWGGSDKKPPPGGATGGSSTPGAEDVKPTLSD